MPVITYIFIYIKNRITCTRLLKISQRRGDPPTITVLFLLSTQEKNQRIIDLNLCAPPSFYRLRGVSYK